MLSHFPTKIVFIVIFNIFISNLSYAEDSVVKEVEKEPVPLSEIQKQQKILEQFKPLIKERSYQDLIKYSEKLSSLKLNRLPDLYDAITPNRAPNIRLIPYLKKSFAHPAYEARFKNIKYLIAVNCEDPKGFDDCSTVPNNRFEGKSVYVRFIQTSDSAFHSVNGMRVGQLYGDVKYLFADDADIHGDGECLKTKDEWLACFDAKLMSVNKARLQMMPANNARLLRFLKIKGRAY